MSETQQEFDIRAARNARDQGIKRVAENNQSFLRVARAIAIMVARRNGDVTCDDVRKECPVLPTHHNAFGAIFKTDYFEWTGEYRQSALRQGHGNMQRVWKIAK